MAPRDTLQLGFLGEKQGTEWPASREASCPEAWPPESLLSPSSGVWASSGLLHTSEGAEEGGYGSTHTPALCSRVSV